MAIAGSKNCRTSGYKAQLASLPATIQMAADDAFKTFLRDPAAPVLHNHALNDDGRGQHRAGSRSVRVTFRVRAIYVFDQASDTNVWYWIGTHGDYDNFVGKT